MKLKTKTIQEEEIDINGCFLNEDYNKYFRVNGGVLVFTLLPGTVYFSNSLSDSEVSQLLEAKPISQGDFDDAYSKAFDTVAVLYNPVKEVA